jgi:hypothetical protein
MGPKPKPKAIVRLVVAAARCVSPLVLSWVRPSEAEVVIMPEARPMMMRLRPNTCMFQASADSSTPPLISITPARSTLKKP